MKAHPTRIVAPSAWIGRLVYGAPLPPAEQHACDAVRDALRAAGLEVDRALRGSQTGLAVYALRTVRPR